MWEPKTRPAGEDIERLGTTNFDETGQLRATRLCARDDWEGTCLQHQSDRLRPPTEGVDCPQRQHMTEVDAMDEDPKTVKCHMDVTVAPGTCHVVKTGHGEYLVTTRFDVTGRLRCTHACRRTTTDHRG